MIQRYRLLALIASACALSAAYLFPRYLGPLVIIGWIPLFEAWYHGQVNGWRAGMLWGGLFFGIHFIWVLHLLQTCSHALWWQALLLYGLVVANFSCISSAWFVANRLLIARVGRVAEASRVRFYFLSAATCSGFLWVIGRWGLWFAQCTHGYPLLHPALPLIHYHWMRVLLLALCGAAPHAPADTNHIRLITVPPSLGSSMQAREGRTPSSTVQAIYHLLTQQRQCTSHGQQPSLYILPESAFPYALADDTEVMHLWLSALPQQSDLLIGTVRERGGARHQVIAHARNGLLTQYYGKTICVDFTERVPRWVQRVNWIAALFGVRSCEVQETITPPVHSLIAAGTTRILLLLCSDFFFTDLTTIDALHAAHPPLVLASVNDSWFMPYMQELMLRYARYKSYGISAAVLYVAHSRAVILLHGRNLFEG